MRYLIRKIVEANSIREALSKEKRVDPVDILSENMEDKPERLTDAIGFHWVTPFEGEDDV